MYLFEDINLEMGKSYRMEIRRTKVDYIHKLENLYEIQCTVNGKRDTETPGTIFKDLKGSMRIYSKCPDTPEGIKITCIDTGEVLINNVKPKNKKK